MTAKEPDAQTSVKGLCLDQFNNLNNGDYLKCVYAHGNAYKLNSVYRVRKDRIGRVTLTNENGIKCTNSLSRFIEFDPMAQTITITVPAGFAVEVRKED